MQQRYYDPGIGMFLSVDPVTAYSDPIGQFHRYRYANNNPYKFTDPDGRIACVIAPPAPICLGIAAKIIAVAKVLLGGAVIASGATVVLNEVVEDSAEPESGGDRPTGDDVKIDDKIKGQLGDRGWTEEGVRELTKTEPAGTSTDNTGGRNDPATVYGTKDDGHVVVNDKTGNVTQVSDKTTDWKPDPRIEWKDDK